VWLALAVAACVLIALLTFLFTDTVLPNGVYN
jgi:hypothetical protein